MYIETKYYIKGLGTFDSMEDAQKAIRDAAPYEWLVDLVRQELLDSELIKDFYEKNKHEFEFNLKHLGRAFEEEKNYIKQLFLK